MSALIWISGLFALALMVYLFAVLLFPEQLS